MDQLYLLLITNKGSNIMEDLDTLRLLGKGAERSSCRAVLRRHRLHRCAPAIVHYAVQCVRCFLMCVTQWFRTSVRAL